MAAGAQPLEAAHIYIVCDHSKHGIIDTWSAGPLLLIDGEPTASHHPSANLLQKIADELENMRQESESLGSLLCSDPDVAMWHLAALHSLDLLAQTQLALAKILCASNPDEALANTNLHNLRKRLMNAHW